MLPKKLSKKINKRLLVASATATIAVGLGVYLLTAHAASFTAVPNATTVTGNWTVGGAVSNHLAIDEGSTVDTNDYVQAPLGIDTTTLNVDTTNPTSVASATQVKLYLIHRWWQSVRDGLRSPFIW